MTLLLDARLTRCPLPFDPVAGSETRAAFADLSPELRDLLAGTAGCSPYLRGLLQAEGDWLRGALETPPEAWVTDLIAQAGATPPAPA